MDYEWISASEAYRLVCQSNPMRATEAICARAHDGLIAARARRLVYANKVMDDCSVHESFWRDRGIGGKCNWASGDFEVGFGIKVARAYGVEFLKEDIFAMLPRSGVTLSRVERKRGEYMPASVCIGELKNTLKLELPDAANLVLRNCRAGLVPARCKRLWWRDTTRYGDEEQELENVEVPDWVWENCLDGPDAVLNWPANTIAGEGVVEDNQRKVIVSGLVFEIGAIIDVEALEIYNRPSLPLPETASEPKEQVTLTLDLPPLSDAALMKWWKVKANVREMLSVEEITVLIRAAHPEHKISRDRIRNLAGGRKRGPKGIGGKVTAE
ncbi:hypothetical protein [Sphingomonas koreensis]